MSLFFSFFVLWRSNGHSSARFYMKCVCNFNCSLETNTISIKQKYEKKIEKQNKNKSEKKKWKKLTRQQKAQVLKKKKFQCHFEWYIFSFTLCARVCFVFRCCVLLLLVHLIVLQQRFQSIRVADPSPCWLPLFQYVFFLFFFFFHVICHYFISRHICNLQYDTKESFYFLFYSIFRF